MKLTKAMKTFPPGFFYLWWVHAPQGITWPSGGLAAEKEGTPALPAQRPGRSGILRDAGSGRENPDSTAVLVPTLSSLYTTGTLMGDTRLLHTITDR